LKREEIGGGKLMIGNESYDIAVRGACKGKREKLYTQVSPIKRRGLGACKGLNY
jgi:hypothetical protein